MSKITIYSKACNKVAGFQQMGEEFIRKLVINNKAKSTHENYLRQMSKLSLYYKRAPLIFYKSSSDLLDKKCHFREMSLQNEMQNLQTSSPKIIDSTIL